MSDDASRRPGRARRDYTVIDRADLVDVTSYDSFPASDPPSWIATGIGAPHDDGDTTLPNDNDQRSQGMII